MIGSFASGATAPWWPKMELENFSTSMDNPFEELQSSNLEFKIIMPKLTH